MKLPRTFLFLIALFVALTTICSANTIEFKLESTSQHGTIAVISLTADVEIEAGAEFTFTYKNSPSRCDWFDFDVNLVGDKDAQVITPYCKLKSSNNSVASISFVSNDKCDGFVVKAEADIDAEVEIVCDVRLALESAKELIKDALTIAADIAEGWALGVEVVIPKLEKINFPESASVETAYNVESTIAGGLDISTLEYSFSGDFPANAIIPLRLSIQIDGADYTKSAFGLDTLADLIATRAYGRQHSCGTDIRLFFSAAANLYGYDAFLLTGGSPAPSGSCSLPFSKAFLIASSATSASNPFGVADILTKDISIKTTFGETSPVTSVVNSGPFQFQELKIIRGSVLPTIIAGTFINIIAYVGNAPTFKIIEVKGEGRDGEGLDTATFQSTAKAFYYAAVTGDESGSGGGVISVDLTAGLSFDLSVVTNHAMYIGFRLPVIDSLKITSFSFTFELDGVTQTIYHQPAWKLKPADAATKVESVSNDSIQWSAKVTAEATPTGPFTSKFALKPFIYPELRLSSSYHPECTFKRFNSSGKEYETDDSNTAIEYKIAHEKFFSLDQVSRAFIEVTGKHIAGDSLLITCTHKIVEQAKLPLAEQHFDVLFQDSIRKYSVSAKSFALESAAGASWTELELVDPAVLVLVQSKAIASKSDYDSVISSAISALQNAGNTGGTNLLADIKATDLLVFDFNHSWGVAYGFRPSLFLDPFPGFSIDTLSNEGSYLRFGIPKSFFTGDYAAIFGYSFAPGENFLLSFGAVTKFSGVQLVKSVSAETFYAVDGSDDSSYIPALGLPLKSACYSSFQAPLGFFCEDGQIAPLSELLNDSIITGLNNAKIASFSSGDGALTSASQGVKYAYLDVEGSDPSNAVVAPSIFAIAAVVLCILF